MPPASPACRAARALSALALAALAAACAGGPLGRRVESALAEPSLAGARWGLVVAKLDGEEVIAIRPDERFQPASNVKLFTTAAAYRWLGEEALDAPQPGAAVRLEPDPEGGAPDLVLEGSGDVFLSDREGCASDCLATLADAVAASGVKRIRHVIGDDRLFPDERWSPGWSWEDTRFYYGAGVSALVVSDNVSIFDVAPGASDGARATATWRDGDRFFPLTADIVTSPPEIAAGLEVDRAPGGGAVRVHGSIPAGAPPIAVRIGVEDPAQLAAFRLKRLVEARGVRVQGDARARHRPAGLPPVRPDGDEIARPAAPPLRDAIRALLVRSQNLYAEVLLRRLGLVAGGGSREDGLALVEAMLAEAGVPRASYDLADGSGLSVYDRVTPRAMTAFLVWAAAQPWGEAWRAQLPVGGEDGGLARRFGGGPLAGRIVAKTGSLQGVTALSGYLIADSGELLAFAAFANDRPAEAAAGDATAAMDRALEIVAHAR